MKLLQDQNKPDRMKLYIYKAEYICIALEEKYAFNGFKKHCFTAYLSIFILSFCCSFLQFLFCSVLHASMKLALFQSCAQYLFLEVVIGHLPFTGLCCHS